LEELKIRQFQSGDVERINTIFLKTGLGVPSARNAIVNRVFEVRDEVVAYGSLQCFGELHLTLDPSLNSLMKARIIDSGVRIGLKYGMNLERIHCIIEDPKEVEILKKHHGFKEVPGVLLFREL
jgi:hypothetical protein